MDFWKENENIIDGNVDTLKLAYLIKKYGLPDDTELRTKILLNLNINNEDNYKIDYFKLCDCCDNFKHIHSLKKFYHWLRIILVWKVIILKK